MKENKIQIIFMNPYNRKKIIENCVAKIVYQPDLTYKDINIEFKIYNYSCIINFWTMNVNIERLFKQMYLYIFTQWKSKYS